ncbi:hypothetical protein ACIRBZ_09215 [Streptomyces sp. NPDC094038]|uniref:hypothetical protein n=1 Tax=Streptomyces sp. NPDC094038 TaxID=3366055 RepID=UPI0038150695
MSDPGMFFALLVDPEDAAPGPLRLELPPGTSPAVAAAALAAVFHADPGLERVEVTVGGQPLGVSRRERFAGALSEMGSREFGGGDHAALPGLSRRFALLRFACRDCDLAVLRVHADGQPPSCPDHGPMELTR